MKKLFILFSFILICSALGATEDQGMCSNLLKSYRYQLLRDGINTLAYRRFGPKDSTQNNPDL